MKQRVLICLLVGLLCSVAAYANEDIGYSYVQALWVDAELDDGH